jgi:RecA-family ATPase
MKHQLPLDSSLMKEHLSGFSQDYILKGLLRTGVGFLIAPPGVGKSYLCMSIAYELATGIPLLGLSNTDRALRTLIWCNEDSLSATIPRIEKHLAGFSKKSRDAIASNISIYTEDDPICNVNSQDSIKTLSSVSNLIEAAEEYDLVIIDTLRTSVGSADEVRDDSLIRRTLDLIAKESNTAVLVVHHPTKNVARGNDVINSVAGSGLSSTLSKSKLHLYLNKTTKKGESVTTLQHIKANYLQAEDLIDQPKEMSWTENSLLCLYPEALTDKTTPKTKVKTAKQKSVARIPREQVIIEVSDEEDASKLSPGGLAQELWKRKEAKKT